MAKEKGGKGLSYQCNSYSLKHNGQAIGSGPKAGHANSYSIRNISKKPA
jgi:hypothetical protein